MEFDFDLAADTAYSVASEMVSDLSLSHDDATVGILLSQNVVLMLWLNQLSWSTYLQLTKYHKVSPAGLRRTCLLRTNTCNC